MYFEPEHIYHIYNQGNNRQPIFFTHENYLFFLKKITKHVLPYADVLAWCLMPNHFHLMVRIKICSSASEGVTQNASKGMTQSHTLTTSTQNEGFTPSQPSASQGFTLSEALTEEALTETETTLNQAIGIMLRSYTRAINKEQQRTGSLFRKETKAECITKTEGITPSFWNTAHGTIINSHNPEREYTQTCFDYIHNNPLQARLVNRAEEWEFSSLRDYMGLRAGKIINRKLAEEWGLEVTSTDSEGFTSTDSTDSEGFTSSETLTGTPKQQ